MFQLEVCVDSIESSLNAVEAGASRLELCSALSEGGLTPTLGLFKTIKKAVSLHVILNVCYIVILELFLDQFQSSNIRYDKMSSGKRLQLFGVGDGCNARRCGILK